MGSKEAAGSANTLLVPGSQSSCRGCGKGCGARDKPVQCQLCGSQYHPSCAGKYQVGANGGISRCCGSRPASPVGTDMLSAAGSKPLTLNDLNTALATYFDRFQEKQDKKHDTLNETVKELANEQRQLRTTLEESAAATNSRLDAVETKVEVLETAVTEMKSEFAELRESGLSEDDIMAEIEDRNRRASNIILYDVPESDNQDLGHITEILAPIELSTAPLRCYRIGPAPSNAVQGKPRPLIVVLSSRADVAHTIKNRNRVKIADRVINVKRDLTERQRAQLKKAVVALEAKKSAGEKDWVLRYQRGLPCVVKKTEKN